MVSVAILGIKVTIYEDLLLCSVFFVVACLLYPSTFMARNRPFLLLKIASTKHHLLNAEFYNASACIDNKLLALMGDQIKSSDGS